MENGKVVFGGFVGVDGLAKLWLQIICTVRCSFHGGTFKFFSFYFILISIFTLKQIKYEGRRK